MTVQGIRNDDHTFSCYSTCLFTFSVVPNVQEHFNFTSDTKAHCGGQGRRIPPRYTVQSCSQCPI